MRDTQMTTRVTEGVRQERHQKDTFFLSSSRAAALIYRMDTRARLHSPHWRKRDCSQSISTDNRWTNFSLDRQTCGGNDNIRAWKKSLIFKFLIFYTIILLQSHWAWRFYCVGFYVIFYSPDTTVKPTKPLQTWANHLTRLNWGVMTYWKKIK